MASSETPASIADRLAVGFAIVYPTLLTLGYFILAAGAATSTQQTIYSVGKLIQFAFPLVWVWAIQRRRPRWKPPALNDLVLGGLFGAVICAATIGLYFLAGFESSTWFAAAAEAIQAKMLGAGVQSGAQFAALGVFYSLVHSLLEEYYWRWFVFGQLRLWTSLRTAIVVSSLGFMAHHVLVLGYYFGWASPATCLLSAAVAIGGALWAWLYQRSGALWGVWLSHLLVDAGIFVVGYFVVRSVWV